MQAKLDEQKREMDAEVRKLEERQRQVELEARKFEQQKRQAQAELEEQKRQAEAEARKFEERQRLAEAELEEQKRLVQVEPATDLALDPERLFMDPLLPLLGSGSSADTRRGTYRFKANPADVALKLFRGGNAVSGEVRRQIMQEIRIGARLQHKNLIQLFGTIEVPAWNGACDGACEWWVASRCAIRPRGPSDYSLADACALAQRDHAGNG